MVHSKWIESFVAKNDYSDTNGLYKVDREKKGFFPLVDFQKGQNLVNLKTVDTTGSTWLSCMEDHIGDLGRNGATVSGKPANMILDLWVQSGGATDASQLIRFGRAINIAVVVKEFK